MKIVMFVVNRSRLRTVFVTFSTLISLMLAAQAWAQGSGNCTDMCNWYSNIYALCQNQDSGWGWENSASCIGRQTCDNQWGNGGVVEVCDDDNQDEVLCAALDGRVYYSNALFEMGLSPTGEIIGHRQVSFVNGEFKASESDYVVSGAYRCENGNVIASLPDDENHILDIAADLNTLNFSAFSDDTPVAYSLGANTAADCRIVENTHYRADPSGNAAVDEWISFAQQPAAQMNISGTTHNAAHYDCETGELHIHRNANDSNPLPVTIEEEGAAIIVHLDTNTQSRFLREEGSICTTEYAPVCSVVPTDIVCVTEPCPVGEYKTFSNRCRSDSADAMFISEGTCGDLEGQPYYEDTGGCTTNWDPVCAAVTLVEPCLSSPCPIKEYKTFSNRCFMQIAGASMIRQGECEAQEGQRIFDLSSEGLACPAVYAPVCAKEESGNVCVTAPCETHLYKTFGNACEASVFVADVAWPHQACGALEDKLVTEQPPVQTVASLDTTDKTPSVSRARIENDVLYVTLGYSGCSEQHFNLQIERAFAESYPVQARWAFIPQVEDFCDAAFQSDFVYDLRPLKALYREHYGSAAATIVLPGLLDYEIESEINDDETTTSIQELEPGFCSVDGTIDNNHSGFTGSGFANTDNAAGNGIEWQFSTDGEPYDSYTLSWRYANASSTNRQAYLEINYSDALHVIDFESTGGWSSWSSSSLDINLLKGSHRFRLFAATNEGLPNIDSLEITGKGTVTPAATCFSSSSSTSSGSTSSSSSSGSVGG